MKKILCLLSIVILTGCAQNIPKEYNVQVERYDKIIDESYPAAYEKSDDPLLLKTDVSLFDIEVRNLQEQITKDGIISEEELTKFTKKVNELEEMVKNG